MNSKLLSLIIPSYNMEKLLGRCIESLLPDKLNNIEIIIVNDGSKDNTLLVANKYKGNYPDVIVVIDKPNGNYGSCINEGLKVAKGKYIKILDADDWVNSKDFKIFVKKLEYETSDLVLTDFHYIYNDIHKELKSFDIEEGENLIEIFNNPTFWSMEMHAVSYKTSLLKDNFYQQTTGISYTDQEWIFIPMQYVNTISYYKLDVYQYFLGRDGQTMDPKVENLKIKDKIVVVKKIILAYKNFDKNRLGIRMQYFDYRFYSYLRSIYKNYILLQDTDEKLKELEELDIYINKNLPQVFEEMNDFMIHKKFLPIKFIKNWRRDKKRSNYFIRLINHQMKKLQNKY